MVKRIFILFFIIATINLAKGQDKKSMDTWSERISQAQTWFDKYDINSDEKLSLEEFPEEAMKWWKLANFDEDNFITWEEENKFQKEEYERDFITKMRQTERFCSFQQHLDGKLKPVTNQHQNISGEWLLFSTMNDNGKKGNGIMYLIVNQKKNRLKGELKQLATPGSEDIEFKLDINNQLIGKYSATVSGKFVQSTGDRPMLNLFFLKREDVKSNFTAFFVGHISSDGRTIIAQLSNNLGFYGTMLMIRRDSVFKLNTDEIIQLSMQNK
jgi:hypothetical protein